MQEPRSHVAKVREYPFSSHDSTGRVAGLVEQQMAHFMSNDVAE